MDSFAAAPVPAFPTALPRWALSQAREASAADAAFAAGIALKSPVADVITRIVALSRYLQLDGWGDSCRG